MYDIRLPRAILSVCPFVLGHKGEGPWMLYIYLLQGKERYAQKA